MRPAFYDNPDYRRKQSEITKRYLRLHPRVKTVITRICSNSNCSLPFQIEKPSDPKIYCGHSCATTINNLNRLKKSYFCAACHKQLLRSDRKYCSLKCQQGYYYNEYIVRWKQGLESGGIGITTHVLSGHIERFLKEKYGDRCCLCGWSQKHQITNKVPLEVDHIDGNSENNKEENLRLICPNCHSLTSSFRNLNKGKGRTWRLLKIAQSH